MIEAGSKTRGKIRSARQWLSKAEDHFDQNAQTRGELELLLAEAELRSTCDNLRSRPGWLNMSLIQQGIAFGLAAVMAVAGISAAWLWNSEQAENAPLPNVAATIAVTAPVNTAQPQNISAVSVPKSESTPTVTVESTNHGQEVKSTDKSANREVTVSQDEMKRLVQTAGQSLRGRTKP